MVRRDWSQEYERAIRSPRRPAQRSPTPSPEQRQHPRLRPRGLNVEIGVTPGLHLIDIDAQTVELYADAALQPGRRLSLRIEPAAPLSVEVIDCAVEETDPALLEVRYRVRCQILPAPHC